MDTDLGGGKLKHGGREYNKLPQDLKMVTNPIPILLDVEVIPESTFNNKGKKCVAVTPIWSGVDRANTGGWVVHLKHANRLVKAIKAGAVCSNPEIKTDINGKTYVYYTSKIMGKYINEDLKKLGF